MTAAYQNDRPQVLAILKSAGLPPPVVQNPADIRLGTLNAGPTVAASATNSTGLGFDACAAPGAAVMSAWLAPSPATRRSASTSAARTAPARSRT